jgi:hypothetical protein
MLTWVDDQIQPVASALARHEEGSDGEAQGSEPPPSGGGGSSQNSAHDMQRTPSAQSAGGAR